MSRPEPLPSSILNSNEASPEPERRFCPYTFVAVCDRFSLNDIFCRNLTTGVQAEELDSEAELGFDSLRTENGNEFVSIASYRVLVASGGEKTDESSNSAGFLTKFEAYKHKYIELILSTAAENVEENFKWFPTMFKDPVPMVYEVAVNVKTFVDKSLTYDAVPEDLESVSAGDELTAYASSPDFLADLATVVKHPRWSVKGRVALVQPAVRRAREEYDGSGGKKPFRQSQVEIARIKKRIEELEKNPQALEPEFICAMKEDEGFVVIVRNVGSGWKGRHADKVDEFVSKLKDVYDQVYRILADNQSPIDGLFVKKFQLEFRVSVPDCFKPQLHDV